MASTTTTATATSFYEVLGIPASASRNEIKSAYRRLARACHPDVVSFEHKENSANEFMKIHAAYSTLSDPDKRATYDSALFANRQRPFGYPAVSASPDMGFSQYSSYRRWETDQCW